MRIEQLRKAGGYLVRRDLVGLMAAVRRYRGERQRESARTPIVIHPRPAEPNAAVLEAERRFWAEADIDLVRRVAWQSIPSFGWLPVLAMTGGKTGLPIDLIVEMLAKRAKEPRGLRGLALGSGEFAMERGSFTDPRLSFAEIDAYDLNDSAFEKGRENANGAGLEVHFVATDINRLVLPRDTFDLVVVIQSFHHFERIEHLAREINRALTPGGVFFLVDYIGPRFLQYSERQLAHAQPLLEALPEKYRLQIDGRVRHRITAVALDSISPDEAICSDLILGAVGRNLDVVWQYNWAGLLYPLLEGIAFNFSEDKPEDRALTELFFNLDRVLCAAGAIEPNFTYSIATKR
ncbi:MAG: class I SAM-dependent methyltransferase [Candidatus Binatia bacterium]